MEVWLICLARVIRRATDTKSGEEPERIYLVISFQTEIKRGLPPLSMAYVLMLFLWEGRALWSLMERGDVGIEQNSNPLYEPWNSVCVCTGTCLI